MKLFFVQKTQEIVEVGIDSSQAMGLYFIEDFGENWIDIPSQAAGGHLQIKHDRGFFEDIKKGAHILFGWQKRLSPSGPVHDMIPGIRVLNS